MPSDTQRRTLFSWPPRFNQDVAMGSVDSMTESGLLGSTAAGGFRGSVSQGQRACSNQVQFETRTLQELEALSSGQERLEQLVQSVLARLQSTSKAACARQTGAPLIDQFSPEAQFQEVTSTESHWDGHLEDKRYTVECDPASVVAGSTTPSASQALSQPRGSQLSDDQRASRGDGKPSEPSSVPVFLPKDWPRCLELRAMRTIPGVTAHRSTLLVLRRGASAFAKSSDVSGEAKRWHVLQSVRRSQLIAWFDTLGIFVLLYDLTAIPFILAWDVAWEGFIYYMAWLAVSFWTVNVTLALIQRGGGGRLGDDHNDDDADDTTVGRHWVWFATDVFVLITDWASTIISEVGAIEGNSRGTMRLLRFAKLGRLLKIMSVLRVLKFARMLEDLMESPRGDGWRLMVTVVSILAGILWLTHLLCCTWFALGRTGPTDTGDRWIHSRVLNGFEDQSYLYQYFTSVHWAVAHITLGGMDVTATSSSERLFSIVCLILGLLIGSTVVSSLSAKMVEYHMQRNEKEMKVRRLRVYLRENHVDIRLALLVIRQVRRRLSKKPRLVERAVPLLELLSTAFKVQLRVAVFRPHLTRHPLLRLLDSLDAAAVQQLCFRAMEYCVVDELDEVFTPGKVSPAAYVPINGCLVYSQDPSSFPHLTEHVSEQVRDSWISEASLWCHWIHVGTLEAKRTSLLMCINAESFSQVLQGNFAGDAAGREIVKKYGLSYHRCIIAAGPPRSPYPTDLVVPFTDYGYIVASFDEDYQVVIGREALGSHRWRLAGTLDVHTLMTEVENGISVVTLDGNREVERVVSAVAFRIVDKDNRILAQVGKYEDNEMIPGCTLPGGKQERREVASDVMERLLRWRLAPFAGSVEFSRAERDIGVKYSKKLGVRTKYLRTVYHAKLTQNHSARRLSATLEKSEHVKKLAKQPSWGATLLKQEPRFDKSSEILVINELERVCFYMWLHEHEFEYYRSGNGDVALTNLLANLNFDPQQNPSETPTPPMGAFSRAVPSASASLAIGLSDGSCPVAVDDDQDTSGSENERSFI
mmetsp:Transcript_12607/g.28573  ORF Transcript_12607/g.28573 Transcript_12607/m.28573 type:complete len:1039 (-) Transcript_12607:147-3263(-)